MKRESFKHGVEFNSKKHIEITPPKNFSGLLTFMTIILNFRFVVDNFSKNFTISKSLVN